MERRGRRAVGGPATEGINNPDKRTGNVHSKKGSKKERLVKWYRAAIKKLLLRF